MTLTHWTLLLAAAAVALLVAVLIKLSRADAGRTDAGDAIARAAAETGRMLQREIQQTGAMQRREQQAALESVSQQTGAVVRETYALRQDLSDRFARMQNEAYQRAAEQQTALTRSIEQLQQGNEQKLEQMRRLVDEKLSTTLNERLDASFQNVSQQLANVYRSLGEMREISDGITSLNRVLGGVKTRGVWAEAQLETLLEQLLPGMYVKNFHAAGAAEVVEFAVRVPTDGGKEMYLPIDSKFPTEDYLRLCDARDAGDDAAVKAAQEALERSVRVQAKNISKYIAPPETTPFAVMYLATDALYATVMASKSDLADSLHTRYRVLLAGPSTITALLSTFALGFRTAALNEKAGEVMALLAQAKAQYEKFGEALQKARRKLEEAGRSLEDAEKRNDVIVKKLRNVETPADAGETALPIAQNITE